MCVYTCTCMCAHLVVRSNSTSSKTENTLWEEGKGSHYLLLHLIHPIINYQLGLVGWHSHMLLTPWGGYELCSNWPVLSARAPTFEGSKYQSISYTQRWVGRDRCISSSPQPPLHSTSRKTQTISHLERLNRQISVYTNVPQWCCWEWVPAGPQRCPCKWCSHQSSPPRIDKHIHTYINHAVSKCMFINSTIHTVHYVQSAK